MQVLLFSSAQILRNLVKRSVRTITEIYQDLDRRLMSKAKKEQKRMTATEMREILKANMRTHTLY